MATIAKLTREEKTMYDSSLKARWDYENTIAYAEETVLEKGMKHGMKQGVKQGIEKGIEQGIKQGISRGEHNKALSIGLKLKLDGTTPAKISELTGLTIEDIEKL